MSRSPLKNKTVVLLLGSWLVLAFMISLSGVFYAVPAPVVGVTNWGLVGLSLIAIWRFPPLRAWIDTVDLRALVLYHTVRFVGIAFLILYAQGKLPYAFAVPGGWGDIVIAVLAIGVAMTSIPIKDRRRWWRVMIWNVLGLIDILMVIGTGLRIGLSDMSQMVALTAFPLSMLPLFIVPLIITTHVVIFLRLRTAISASGSRPRW